MPVTNTEFDYLAFVVFREDFSVDRACLIPRERLNDLAASKWHTYQLRISHSVWEEDGVEDITRQVRIAAGSSV